MKEYNIYNKMYRGIILQNNDPEQAGRVKVFVPEVNMSLYDGWNNLDDDKNFNNLGENVESIFANQDLKERLLMALPWAELAQPLFGMTASGFYHAKKNVSSVENDPQNTGSNWKNKDFAALGNETPHADPTIDYAKGVTPNTDASNLGTVQNEKILDKNAPVAAQILEFEVDRNDKYFNPDGSPKSFGSFKRASNGSIYQDNNDPELAGGLVRSYHKEAYDNIKSLPPDQQEAGIVKYIDTYTKKSYSNPNNSGVDLAIRDSIWNKGGYGTTLALTPYLRSQGYNVTANKNSPWNPTYKAAVDDAAATNPNGLIAALGSARAAGQGDGLRNRAASVTAIATDRSSTAQDADLPVAALTDTGAPTGALFNDGDENTTITPEEFANEDVGEFNVGVPLNGNDSGGGDGGYPFNAEGVYIADTQGNLGTVVDPSSPVGNNSNEPDTNLPFKGVAQSNKAKGIISVPTTGAHVWVFFDNGDSQRPIVMAGIFGAEDYKGIYDVPIT